MTTTNLVELAVPTPALPTLQGNQALAFAESFVVDSPLAAEMAAAEYTDIRARLKLVEEQHDKLKRPVLEAGRAIDTFFRPFETALRQAGQLLNDKLSAYEDARKQKEQEAERKAREAERVEKERIARQAAEREQLAQAEALRLRAAATELEADGNMTAAREYAERASQAELAGQQDAQLMLEELVPAPREPIAPKPSSIVTKETWEWEGLDVMATCQAIVEGKAPLRVLMYNLVAVTKMVNALKHEFNVPGIVARPKTTIAAKGKR